MFTLDAHPSQQAAPTRPPAVASGTFLLGRDLPVRRLGFGTMQLTGPGHWYHPRDLKRARRVLRRAVDLGVNHIDTADAYGPETSEHLIRQALHPYPDGLVIATKGGLTRQGPNRWAPVGRPEYLRQCVETSLRRLAIDRIGLYYLHRIDPRVPLADQLGVLAELQAEGKIRHLGLSKVTVDQIERASQEVEVVAVQNPYSLSYGTAVPHQQRYGDEVLAWCETAGVAFVPYRPLGAGKLLRRGGPLTELARAHEATPAQLALAWLLHRSPVMLPIPGSYRASHVEENARAAELALTGGAVASVAASCVAAGQAA